MAPPERPEEEELTEEEDDDADAGAADEDDIEAVVDAGVDAPAPVVVGVVLASRATPEA